MTNKIQINIYKFVKYLPKIVLKPLRGFSYLNVESVVR